MSKQLIIEHCNECFLRDDYVGFKFPRCMYPCSVLERHKEIKQEELVDGFPEWCPLPDTKGEK